MQAVLGQVADAACMRQSAADMSACMRSAQWQGNQIAKRAFAETPGLAQNTRSTAIVKWHNSSWLAHLALAAISIWHASQGLHEHADW
jgi:hypothetical protein